MLVYNVMGGVGVQPSAAGGPGVEMIAYNPCNERNTMCLQPIQRHVHVFSESTHVC